MDDEETQPHVIARKVDAQSRRAAEAYMFVDMQFVEHIKYFTNL